MILKPAALLAAFVALTFAGSVFAADPVNIEIMAVEEQPGSMILTVSAVDENGKPFPGLDPSSFNAWINDTALIVKELHAATDRQPASVLLLVDVSGSMSGEPIQQAQVAINEFIDVLEPTDEVALMTFSSGVTLVQDFTADRDQLNSAVAGLQLTNDTDLYDGVIEAANKMTEAPRSRKLIVLLSDGLANINQGARDASIDTAQTSGVSFVAVGLGANTDRDYLSELTSASGGSLIEAATPAELRAAYTSLAFAIRSQYTLVTEVPRSIDRTVPGTLKVHVIHRADNAFAERALEPLAGAVPPPFTMAVDGVSPGEKHNGSVELIPTVQEGIEVAKIEYYLDDQVVFTGTGLDTYTMDASQLANGSHVLKVVATDIQGREGEVQVPFLVPVLVAPSQGKSLPIIPILILAVLAVLAYFGFKVGKKRFEVLSTPTYSRVDNWASIRTPGGGTKAPEWVDDGDNESAHPLSRPAADEETANEPVVGRVVIMDEAAVRGGELETIREFDMTSTPLTFGSGPNADMRVDDAGGLIAAEEARVWVQRGRLVYHKLTTLSAMATEGVTAGWQFLDNGDEMRVGPYRIIYQTQEAEELSDETSPIPDRMPQEHGMALHRAFGLTENDRNPDMQEWLTAQGPAAPQAAPDATEESPDPSAETVGEAAEPESSRETESEPRVSTQWAIDPPAAASEPSDSAAEPTESSDWGRGDMSEPGSAWGGSESADPGWSSLEQKPNAADWIVEQSQPVDDGVGPIVQPDAWSTFVSSDDEETPTAPEPDLGEDEEDRAWGT
jgi:VWFA-related protein